MNILALILARGGSKRLPGKNIRLLAGKPLISWTIEVAKNVSGLCDILVSTDCAVIADVAKNAGALVPWLRPESLSGDTATSSDAAIHAVDWYEQKYSRIDGVLLLQPTSPFRASETIEKGIRLFESENRQAVIGVSPTHSHPAWTYRITDNYLIPFLPEYDSETRSQDLPPAYIVNGSFYLISPDELRMTRTFMPEQCKPLIIESRKEVLDIDDEWDFRLAEFLLS